MKKNRTQLLGRYVQRSFVLFSVVPMLLACSICMMVTLSIYEHSNRQSLEINLSNAAEDMDQWLRDSFTMLKACANDEEIVAQMQSASTLNSSGKGVVDTLLTGRSSGVQLHLLSFSGPFRYSTGSIANIYKMPIYRKTGIFQQLQENGTAIRAMRHAAYNGRTVVLTLGVCIYNEEGEAIGCVLLDVYRDKLDDLLDTYDSLLVTDMLLVDGERTVAYSRSGACSEGVRLVNEGLNAILDSRVSSGDVHLLPLQSGRLSLLISSSSEFSRAMYGIVMVGLGAMLLISTAIARLSGTVLARRISRQIQRLLGVMQSGPRTGFSSAYSPEEGDFSEIIQLGEYYNEMSAQTRELIAGIEEKQRLLANAELNVLKMQVRPHFIYNVLNDIKAMAKLSRTREISELVVCFGALMRSSLSTDEEFCTLSEELDLIQKYIHMQNLRALRTVELRLDVDERLLSMEIPRLILQPLVENSLSHGLVCTAQPIIRIAAHAADGLVSLSVTDNGDGIRQLSAPKKLDGVNYHTGIGLKNIALRLKLYYGTDGRLEIRSKPEHYTVVTLTLRELQGNNAEF